MNIAKIPKEKLNMIAGFKVFSVIVEKHEVTLIEDFKDFPNSKVLSHKAFNKAVANA